MCFCLTQCPVKICINDTIFLNRKPIRKKINIKISNRLHPSTVKWFVGKRKNCIAYNYSINSTIRNSNQRPWHGVTETQTHPLTSPVSVLWLSHPPRRCVVWICRRTPCPRPAGTWRAAWPSICTQWDSPLPWGPGCRCDLLEKQTWPIANCLLP